MSQQYNAIIYNSAAIFRNSPTYFQVLRVQALGNRYPCAASGGSTCNQQRSLACGAPTGRAPMPIGYFIRMGDATTCGGEVIEGDTGFIWTGMPQAREGDQVTCGKDGHAYPILGGVSHCISSGRMLAGSLDSISGCPCGALLVPSGHDFTYGSSHLGVSALVSAAPLRQRQASMPNYQPASPPIAQADVRCDERFQLLDQQSQPLGPLEYALLQGDQCIGSGQLDEQGRAVTHGTTAPTGLQIAIRAASPVLE